jgi:hypothetical protein
MYSAQQPLKQCSTICTASPTLLLLALLHDHYYYQQSLLALTLLLQLLLPQRCHNTVIVTHNNRFADAQIDRSRPRGFDFVRQREIGNKDFALTTMEEAFTSEHWLVRIYKVLPQPNLEATAAGIKASGGSTARSSASAPPAAPEIATRLVGCFTSENVFGGKVYVGGASGAQHAVIRDQAAAAGKRYFATARNDVDGHGFLFDVLLPAPAAASAASGGGCERPCADNVSKQCGCMDSTCSGPKPAEEEHNRRWVVYELSA